MEAAEVREIALAVAVNHQNLAAAFSEDMGHVEEKRRLSDTTFVVE